MKRLRDRPDRERVCAHAGKNREREKKDGGENCRAEEFSLRDVDTTGSPIYFPPMERANCHDSGSRPRLPLPLARPFLYQRVPKTQHAGSLENGSLENEARARSRRQGGLRGGCDAGVPVPAVEVCGAPFVILVRRHILQD